MNAVATLETFVLRNLRARGPALLGARRSRIPLAGGQHTDVLELGSPREGTVIFLHGFSDRPEHFLATAAILARHHRVLVPAMFGFGDGPIDVHADHSLETFGARALEIVDRIGGDRFHLMGNSLGGAASLAIATALGERVESLTLVDTAGVKPAGIPCVFDGFEQAENPFEVRTREDHEAFLRKVSHRPNPALGLVGDALFLEARANADWYSRLGHELAVSVRAFVDRGEDAFVDLAAIRTPTLVLWGEHDALFPPAIGRHIAARMPDARFELLRGVGHCPHLEAPGLLASAFRKHRRR